jgi:hypothetical protein
MKIWEAYNPVVEARVYVDDPNIVFIFNGRFWTPVRREDVEDVVVPVVTVVAKGRKYICRNTILEEALASYEKCSATT